MKLSVSIVARRGKKWYIGFLKDQEFVMTKEVKKLSDVKEASSYITLRQHLKKKKKDLKHEKTILKQANFDKIYVLTRPIDPTVEEFESYWWSDLNKVCKDCVKSCKQSSKVKLVSCGRQEKP